MGQEIGSVAVVGLGKLGLPLAAAFAGAGLRVAQDKDSLRDIELFKELPPADLDALAKRCAWRRFSAGQ